jgi:hypothetical protein
MNCHVCLDSPGKLRRCTGLRLCKECRASPEQKIMTKALVLKNTELTHEHLETLEPAGNIVNPVNPCFRRASVYYERDIFGLLIELDLPFPE